MGRVRESVGNTVNMPVFRVNKYDNDSKERKYRRKERRRKMNEQGED